MQLYYIDVVDGPTISLIAGPFVSEAAGRKYEQAAAELALAKGIMSPWGSFGVSSVDWYKAPGRLNEELDIAAEDLVADGA